MIPAPVFGAVVARDPGAADCALPVADRQSAGDRPPLGLSPVLETQPGPARVEPGIVKFARHLGFLAFTAVTGVRHLYGINVCERGWTRKDVKERFHNDFLAGS